jgi:hypothetical protein
MAAWPWLTPAAAAVLMLGLLFGERNDTTLGTGDRFAPLVAMSLSNQSCAAYLPGSFRRTQNRLDTLGWTNAGHFNSSEGQFLP